MKTMESPLELRHLKTLLALRASGNLTRAAELLNLTQSAVSHQIKLLEDWLGTSVFERKALPLRLTPAGERLLKLADQVLPLFEEADRDLVRLSHGRSGTLRIAVECHTCFDWLMPALAKFRPRWPEVDFDFVSGFHSHPDQLVAGGKADLAVLSERVESNELHLFPLFRFTIVGVLASNHPLADKPFLTAHDFENETLITYPVPDEMLDVVRQVLHPAGVEPRRRTSELTNAILQLVASRKGIAALPVWAVHTYLDHHSLALKPITATGLRGELYAAVLGPDAEAPYMLDFISIVRETSFLSLPEVELL